MSASALAALGLSGDLWLSQFARLVDQLPVVLWSTDLNLRITAIRGGGSMVGQHGKTIEEAFGNAAQAAPAVVAHRAAFFGGEPGRIVEDVRERSVELTDVVKERHSLDAAQGALVQAGGLAKYQRVCRNPTDMRAGLGVVCFDRIEERLESGRAQTLGTGSYRMFAIQKPRRGGAEGKRDDVVTHGAVCRKKRTG